MDEAEVVDIPGIDGDAGGGLDWIEGDLGKSKLRHGGM
jgi:hypothetical protein